MKQSRATILDQVFLEQWIVGDQVLLMYLDFPELFSNMSGCARHRLQQA